MKLIFRYLGRYKKWVALAIFVKLLATLMELSLPMEFEEVSGHRVLIKRGPGNRGPSECGTTHEATSGMSS